MEKLPGVESAKVSLNEGRATIQLKPGNAITMAEIRQSVERNGFTPQQAIVSARAEVTARGDTLQLKIPGTNETYDVADTPHADGIRQQLKKHAGNAVLIEAVVPAQKDPKARPLMQVKSVKPVTGQKP